MVRGAELNSVGGKFDVLCEPELSDRDEYGWYNWW